MQPTNSNRDVWTFLLDLTDHPSPRKVGRFALTCVAGACLYVAALAALGVFSGAVWWLTAGLVAGATRWFAR